MINFSFGHDVNGNKVLKVKVPNKRQFTIQTLGQLPLTHRMRSIEDFNTVESEVRVFVGYMGTQNQRDKLASYYSKGREHHDSH